MKSHMPLAMLTCFLSGIILDMTLSRVAIDMVFIAALGATVCVLALMARRPGKKIPSRSQPKVVKSRKSANNR